MSTDDPKVFTLAFIQLKTDHDSNNSHSTQSMYRYEENTSSVKSNDPLMPIYDTYRSLFHVYLNKTYEPAAAKFTSA
jgi:hypothetical protein